MYAEKKMLRFSSPLKIVFVQCCNDVLHERFASEMKYDTALRLAALHIQQHAMSNNMGSKVSIKAVV